MDNQPALADILPEQAKQTVQLNETVANESVPGKNAQQQKPNNQQQQSLQDKQNVYRNKKINKHKKKKQQEIVYKNLNPFKEQEKHYKLYQDRQTDFSQLFDLNQAEKIEIDGFIVYSLPAPEDGAYIIKNFNPPDVVNRIGYLALNEFWKKPYRTNLNSRNQLYEQKEEQKKQVQAKEEFSQNKMNQQQFQAQIKQKGYCFNDKIRWANVGHQYDWTLRKYPEYHTPMHNDIKQLTDRANIIFNKIIKENREYHPESAIVNYYSAKDYMTGHLDDAEYDQVSPIYSFSFGLSCVFLMGGMDKDAKPSAVRLDSGDLMIMSRNSRKCYHGVPRVIAGSYKSQNPLFQPTEVPENFNTPKEVEKYFGNHRVNINIRQVFPEQKQE